jgi:glyoxylase-like metal-dependent hydrolase (beta-lactamase superfamily II)
VAVQPHLWKGRKSPRIKRWDVVTIGNLSRNRYWGESDFRGVRPAICTCTLIAGDSFRLLVDPSLADATDMARELNRRAGIKPRDINVIFVTHEHGDHFAGIAHFGASVATRDFFREQRGYFNAVDFELYAGTMDKLAALADTIVPGHDNYFLADCIA